MRKRFFFKIFLVAAIALTFPVKASLFKKKSNFDFPPKTEAFHYDVRMLDVAEIAASKAGIRSQRRCWRAVKDALFAANVVPFRPTTKYAKQAGFELQQKFAFTKLDVTNPFDAPIGAILVYGGRGAGHVEIRTADGFVSDFAATHPSRRPLLGVYVKV